METTCVHYSRDYVGNPCIVAIDRDRCAVADGTGNVTAVDVRTQEVGPRLFVGIAGGTASNLRSLRRDPSRPGVVAVATRAAYAALGDIGRGSVSKIHPVEGGTVQSVAISPDGRSLAIGTGAYSVSGPAQPAHLEIWDLSHEDGPRHARFAALPGVCVDAIAWSPDGRLIACASGLRSQKAGFVAQLEAGDLRARSFFETTWAGTGRLGYLDASCSRLAAASRGGFRVLGASDGQEAWRLDRPDANDVLPDFDLVPEDGVVVLTGGQVLDATDGARRAKFLAMNDCTSIAARPGGGYLGVSTRGRIYCWD
jgi:WD40 repeat protein